MKQNNMEIRRPPNDFQQPSQPVHRYREGVVENLGNWQERGN